MANHPVNRRRFFQAAAAGLGGATIARGQGEAATATRPNIIFFMMDQLSAKWLEEASARKIIPTPNFDKLARRPARRSLPA